MARNISFATGEFYHIYNRGTEKRKIFSANADYERFLALIYLCNGSIPTVLRIQGRTLYEVRNVNRGNPLIDLCVYCLMPNHFHLLIRERDEGGISRFMQKLTTGYTMYFNTKNERSGALFQGKFKAEHVDKDRYLKYIISYIHLNPIKLIEPQWKEIGISDRKRAGAYLQNYRYSSFLDYAGKDRLEKRLINRSALPDYFESPLSFKTETSDWLDYRTDTA